MGGRGATTMTTTEQPCQRMQVPFIEKGKITILIMSHCSIKSTYHHTVGIHTNTCTIHTRSIFTAYIFNAWIPPRTNTHTQHECFMCGCYLWSNWCRMVMKWYVDPYTRMPYMYGVHMNVYYIYGRIELWWHSKKLKLDLYFDIYLYIFQVCQCLYSIHIAQYTYVCMR